MKTEVKICGVTQAEHVDAAVEAGADYIGLVFFPASPRHVDWVTATGLARHARARVQVVALVVDPTDLDLKEIESNLRPDVIQFHGRERPELLDVVRARNVFQIWKALPVGTADDLALARDYVNVVDRFVLDAKPPKDATRPGGNAHRFDWSLVAGIDLGKPFVLSGGLDPDNVGEALAITRAPTVDVSSGVESAPGVKDPGKIRAFVDAVRAAERRLEETSAS